MEKLEGEITTVQAIGCTSGITEKNLPSLEHSLKTPASKGIISPQKTSYRLS